MNIRRQLFTGMPQEPLKSDGHLYDGWLLRSIDGELSASDYERVEEHVRACWTCRARREQMERTIKEIVEYEHALVAPNMPAAPGANSIFMARLTALSSQLGSPSLLRRWAAKVSNAGRSMHAMRTTWATAAVLTTAFVLYVGFGRRAPIVSADQLLRRAVSSETRSFANISQPVAIEKVTVKAGGHSITRTLYRDTNHRRQASRADVNASEELVIETTFEHSPFIWNDPLSPQSFSQWRDGVVAKKDVVTELGRGLLRLDTSASSGPVAEASLTVRAEDYHPIAEDLRLRDNTEIEVAELSYDVVGLSTLSPDIFGSLAPRERLRFPSVSSASSVHTIRPDAGQIAATELQVRAVLHSIGADLGEEVVVHQEPNGLIQVSGVVEDESRKGQIDGALIGVPHTQVRVITVAQAAADPKPGLSLSASNSTTLVTANPPLLGEQLQKRFPDSDQRTEYVNQSLSLCQSASARAWALNRLADRYTQQQIELLDPHAQQQLQSLLTDHITALREDVGRLQNQLGQVLSSASNTAAANTASSPAKDNQSDDWRDRAHRVHSSVEITNEAVSVLLAGSPENNDSPAKLQLRLRTTLTQLQADLQLLDQQIRKQL